MTEELLELDEKLKQNLDKYRYDHTIGVMHTAACLAMKYDGNIIIAILHLLHKLTVTFSRRCNCRLHFNQDCNTPGSIKNGAILHPSPESKSQKPIQSITLVF